tara:strand:- start:37010 stop:37399 length:390 start_codon:yes stop_codon:yes gene_type:complete
MFKNILKSLVGQASSIIDEVVTTDEERLVLKNKLEQLGKEHEQEVFKLEVEDRKSARTMFTDDSFIQKVLAIIFTCAYFFISYFMFKYFITNSLDLSDYEIGFISTVFGAMSSKVNTIIDFFFGGSSKK